MVLQGSAIGSQRQSDPSWELNCTTSSTHTPQLTEGVWGPLLRALKTDLQGTAYETQGAHPTLGASSPQPLPEAIVNPSPAVAPPLRLCCLPQRGGGGTRQGPGHALLPRTRMGLLSLPARGLSLLRDPLPKPLPSFQPRVNVQSSPGALITQAALIGLLHLARRAQLESEGCPRLPPPPVPALPTSQLSSLTGPQGCTCPHQSHFLQHSLGTSGAPSIGIAWELNQITLQGSQTWAPTARVKAKWGQS